MGLTARAQEVSAIMQNGPLQLAGPKFDHGAVGANFALSSFMEGGVYISLNDDWSWAGGPTEVNTLGSANREMVLVAGWGQPVRTFSTLRVGMPAGGGDLYVLGTIYQGADEKPVPRWLGELSSDPADPRGGDQYFNTSTSKARLFTGSAWIDLN